MWHAATTDGDGLIDLAVTNFYGESTTLFHNLGQGLFVDHTAAARAGCAQPVTFWASGPPSSMPTTTADST